MVMREVVVIASLLGACGRADFESHDAAAVDADPTALRSCSARPITGYDLGSGSVVDVAAARVGDGFVVGVVDAPSSVLFGVHLDDSLTPNAPTPFQTSPASGSGLRYQSANMWWDGTNLVGSVSVDNGTCYLKVFPSDMGQYLWASNQLGGKVSQASVGSAGTQPISTWFSNDVLSYALLAADGTSTDLHQTMSFGSNIAMANVASGAFELVASSTIDGQCQVTALEPSGMIARGALATICAEPFPLGAGTSFDVVYEAGSQIATRSVDGIALAVGPERVVAVGSTPRLMRMNGNRVLVWTAGASLHVAALEDAPTELAVANLPAGAPAGYEVVTASDAGVIFAVYGTSIWAITCS